jgi:hypothetical protein
MPALRYAVPFFIVFGGGSMGHGSKFMLLGGFPVRLVHGVSSCESVCDRPFTCTRWTNPMEIGNVSPAMALGKP